MAYTPSKSSCFPAAVYTAADRLLIATSAHQVVLYGSRARGDGHAESDWNVAVILPDDARLGKWTPSTLGKLASGLGEDIRVVAFRRFVYDQARNNPATISAEVYRDGILLAERPGI